MTILTIIKLVALVYGIWYTQIIIGKLIYGHAISGKILVVQSISIVVFVTIQFKLY